jgi:outer membrane protein assembly factor BamB
VEHIFPIIQYRDASQYAVFEKKKIRLTSLFTLSDFTLELGVKPQAPAPREPLANPFAGVWKWHTEKPHLHHVRPKSEPVFYEDRVLVGTDDGTVVCLECEDGNEVWQYRPPVVRKEGDICSRLCIEKGVVAFGSYDGNVYGLDVATGKRKWVYLDADWVKGSPAHGTGLVFFPLTYGLFKKEGSVVALEAATGTERWRYPISHALEGGITFDTASGMLFFGTEGGDLYALRAKDGVLVWHTPSRVRTRGFPLVLSDEGLVVFSGRPPVDEEQGVACALDAHTGEVRWTFTSFTYGSLGTPCAYEGRVWITALDKYLYCLNASDGKLLYRVYLGARCFSSPRCLAIRGTPMLYVGANNGYLYEMHLETGQIESITYFTERIVNGVVSDQKRKLLLVPTFANEVYALQPKSA